jgi:ATP-binding cassette, subfamily B, multidrug efflux pump
LPDGEPVLVRLLRPALRSHRPTVAAALVLQAVQTLANVYLPALTASILDRGVARGDTGYIARVGSVMLAATLAQVALSAAAVHLAVRVGTRVAGELRAAVFRRVMRMPVDGVAKRGAGPLMNRTIGDVAAVGDVVTALLSNTLLAPLMCLGAVAMALREDARLSGLLLAILPISAVIVGGLLRRIRPPARWLRVRLDDVNRMLREQIAGALVTRTFVRAAHERNRFAEVSNGVLATSIRVGRLTALTGPAIMLVTNVSTVAVLWLGAVRVNEGRMTVGALTAFIAYLTQIFMAASISVGMLATLPRAEACAERIGELLDGVADDVPDTAGPAPITGTLEPSAGGLVVRAVSVRLPEARAPVLSGIDLTALPGQVVAVVGGTGAGKSTLLRVIAGLLSPATGTVRVGGADVTAVPAADRRRLVGLVPQQAFLFAGTVADNLRLGAPDATPHDMWNALAAAQAATFVSQMPDRLDSPITQGGGNVSGGQRQRLAVARTLLARPHVYLLDDCLAALDPTTGAALLASLRVWTAASVVVLAARTATGLHADHVVTLPTGHAPDLSATELVGDRR